jgi:hypothetical protein
MDAMRNLLHFSTIDIDESLVAGIGVIPMPSGPPRVRLFLDGGGVIDLQENREAARDIWLGKETPEERYSRVIEENAKLRYIFDRVYTQAKSLNADRPKEDVLGVALSLTRILEEIL